MRMKPPDAPWSRRTGRRWSIVRLLRTRTETALLDRLQRVRGRCSCPLARSSSSSASESRLSVRPSSRAWLEGDRFVKIDQADDISSCLTPIPEHRRSDAPRCFRTWPCGMPDASRVASSMSRASIRTIAAKMFLGLGEGAIGGRHPLVAHAHRDRAVDRLQRVGRDVVAAVAQFVVMGRAVTVECAPLLVRHALDRCGLVIHQAKYCTDRLLRSSTYAGIVACDSGNSTSR